MPWRCVPDRSFPNVFLLAMPIFPSLGQCVLDRCVPLLGRMLKPNSWTKSRQKSKEFTSLLFTVISLCLEFFLFLQTHATSYSFYSLVTLHCRGERRKSWKKNISSSLWFKKSIKKPQVWELSRLCPETSTKLYVHEFGFCIRRILGFPGHPYKKIFFVGGHIVQGTYSIMHERRIAFTEKRSGTHLDRNRLTLHPAWFLVSVVMNVVLLVTVKNSTSLASDTDSVLLANISLANIILGEFMYSKVQSIYVYVAMGSQAWEFRHRVSNIIKACRVSGHWAVKGMERK